MEAELARFGLSEKYSRLRGVPNVIGTLGCYHSHMKALDLARRQEGFFHVLEDDAILSAGVGPFLESEELARLLEKYDLVYLDMWVDPKEAAVRRYYDALKHPGPMDLKGTRIGCVSSYVVSPRSARKLLRLLRNEKPPTDVIISRLVQAGSVTAAVMVPFLTGIDINFGSHSAIQKMPVEDQRRYVMLRTRFFVDEGRQPAFEIPPEWREDPTVT
jgi:GR25 family glycosyltransferase involved in LPS biosynthesis